MKSVQGFLVVVAMLLILPRAAGAHIQMDDMNDRLSVVTGGVVFSPAAGGYVKTELSQSGSIYIEKLKIHNLGADQDYEVIVTVGPDGSADFEPVFIASSGPIHVKQGGFLKVKDLFVGDFAPGTYRVDIIVTYAGGFFPFLLACEPFPMVTVTAASKPTIAQKDSWGTIKALYR